MNALQDPTKKPSINSLLNPQESSAFPAHFNSNSIGTNHEQNQSHQPFHYSQRPSFHLRAADWDYDDDPNKRRPLNGGHNAHRHYQQHPTLTSPSSHNYADPHASRLMVRSRIDEYTGEGQVWPHKHLSSPPPLPPPPPQQQQQQHQHAVPGMQYAPALIYPEGTTLSGDYQPQSNYPPTYEDQSTSSSNQQLWQHSERVSLRLAARGTVPDPQQQQASQDARYGTPSYYTHPNGYSPSAYPPQQLQPLQQLLVPETPETLEESASSSTRLSSSSATSSSKRQHQEDETTPAPKAKRAKAKTKSATPRTTPASTPGLSKRGYNAKKRSEAALITAQNDAFQRASASNETYLSGSSNGTALSSSTNSTPSATTANTSTDPNNTVTHNNGVSFVPELQCARCMSNRYRVEVFSRCVSCTRRWAGDTCRFQGIRYFLRDTNKKIACVSFREHHQTAEPPVMEFPTVWNRKFKKEHVTRIKLSIAKALLPTLKLEKEHLKAGELVKRPRESEVRATCDTCMTSLFSASWLCRVCGREVCHECFLQVEELTSEPSSASPAELAALQGKREKHAHSNPFFLSCNKRAEHGVGEFMPVTRFWDEELDKAIEEMEDILKGVERERGGGGGRDVVNGMESLTSTLSSRLQKGTEDIRRNGRSGDDSNEPLSSPLSSPPPSDAGGITTSNGMKVVYDSYMPSNLSREIISIPVHRLQQIPASLYDPVPSPPPSPSHNNASKPPSSSSPSVPSPPSFASLWAQGVPILVKDALPRFKLTWTPEYFIQQYGEQSCLIIECQTDVNKRISVGEFFGMFGKYEGRTQCWKLKDWPPSTDFKTAFPGLYQDFSQAVPVPDYVRRDGVFNLGSHFPSNTIAPDLGPKMYNSLASSQEPGSKGSTRLHMDMADALNVMLYASKCEDGTEGYAAWDLFRAEDSDKLRVFLRKKFGQPQNGLGGLGGMGGGGGGNSGGMPIAHDPIHGQQFYLDVELRRALYDECGVMSYRVYQRPGDGVFIPAGCAHQVANMSDCMKIAIDFVSPENIDRCEQLTKEFREQNQSKVWKEDVLQLRTMMWFAWQSCSLQESYLMTKPTLVQSLLNQPSQSYSIPIHSKHDYHSTKQEMLRIAAESDKPRMPHSTSKPHRPSSPPSTTTTTTYHRRANSRLSYNEFEILEPSEESDLDDLFFTPNTSPRTSIASSLLMFPTGRKPSRKSLRLSDASDIVLLGPTSPIPAGNTTTTAATRGMPAGQPTAAATAVLSTRTPSTTASSSRHQNDARTTSLEPGGGGGGGSAGTHQSESVNDRRKGKEGTKYTTRHGTVTLKPNTVVVPSTFTPMQSVKSTTTSKRKSSQGTTDADLTRDVKRPVPPAVSTSTPTSSTPNGAAIKSTVTPTIGASTSTTAPATIGSPQVLASRKSSKSKAHANPSAATSSKEKEKTKQDVVVEPETPSVSKTKEKEKEKDLDTSTPKSKVKDKGKEKAKTIPIPIPIPTPNPTTHHGDGNVVNPEQSTNIPPKTTTPHTFSAFAPISTSTTPPIPSPEKTNGDGNGNIHDKPPLPPAGFSFPPPPLHSPQQHKNSLNGSAAAYTFAHRQKGNSVPKPPPTVGGPSSIMMNMAALLEEDEIDGDGTTQTRRLRHTTANGIENIKGKGKRTSFDSMSSKSGSSHHSHSRSPPQSNGNSNSISNATTSQSHFRSDSGTFRSPPKTLSSEVNSMSLSTPGELPSMGTQGYTSLVLPRAPQPLRSHSTSMRTASTSGTGSQRKWFGKEGKIDLTRSGVAQTTMASVEVVRGLGRQQGQNGFGGKLLGMFGRKRSVSSSGREDVGPRPIEGLGKAADDTKIDPSKGKAPTTAGVEGTVLGFTSYRKPPGYVPSNSVLVQVWAVGVDGIDGRLVGLRFGDHVWSTVRREVTGGNRSGYEDEGGVETEWEREREQEMEGNEENGEVDVSKSTPQQNSNNRGFAGLGRSFSLRMPRTKQQPNQQDHQRVHGQRSGQRQEPSRSYSLKHDNVDQPQPQRRKVLEKKQKRVPHKAEVGYIPGRSFVGRVLECGWDVRDEVVRKGEWVVGLLDVKKCGALTEFIIVDRHRIHRVPHPLKVPQRGIGQLNAALETDASLPFQDDGSNMSRLTLEELSLLPLCGIPAYRAVRTFIYAFSSLQDGAMASPTGGIEFGNRRNSKLTTEHPPDRRRRVLVLRGHDGIGAMAVQMLARRGWKVSVHVPFSSSFVSDQQQPTTTTTNAVEEHDSFPRDIQGRARDWGADEIIFDEEAGGGIDDGRIAAIRVIESLREDGDVFDAILDTVGGKEVREAGERLLRSPGVGGPGEPMSPKTPNKAKGVGQFTTLIGDVPERPIPTAGDNFRAGLRSLRFGSNDASAGNADAGNGDEGGNADMKGNKVGYAWVSVAQDVDWEGEDIGDTLASILRLALEDGVRPVVGDGVANHHRVVPFEKAPYAFVERGPLGHGRTVVVKIAG